MSNHYHLLLETPEVGLSRGMRWLNQMYAESFNERHERVGHLFQGRFKGILVERESHLLELLRYIVLNPVRAGIVKFAGDYAWSNYRATARLRPAPKWLDVDWTLEQFGPDRVAACEEYRRFVADARGASYNPWEQVVGQIYLGGDEFCDRMQSLVRKKQRSPEHPRPQRSFVRPSLDALVGSLTEVFDVAADDLKEKSRNTARKALAHLAVDEVGATMQQLSAWMQTSIGAVSKLRSASYDRYANDPEYRLKFDRVRNALS